jgi:hypothetical protein
MAEVEATHRRVIYIQARNNLLVDWFVMSLASPIHEKEIRLTR